MLPRPIAGPEELKFAGLTICSSSVLGTRPWHTVGYSEPIDLALAATAKQQQPAGRPTLLPRWWVQQLAARHDELLVAAQATQQLLCSGRSHPMPLPLRKHVLLYCTTRLRLPSPARHCSWQLLPAPSCTSAWASSAAGRWPAGPGPRALAINSWLGRYSLGQDSWKRGMCPIRALCMMSGTAAGDCRSSVAISWPHGTSYASGRPPMALFRSDLIWGQPATTIKSLSRADRWMLACYNPRDMNEFVSSAIDRSRDACPLATTHGLPQLIWSPYDYGRHAFMHRGPLNSCRQWSLGNSKSSNRALDRAPNQWVMIGVKPPPAGKFSVASALRACGSTCLAS